MSAKWAPSRFGENVAASTSSEALNRGPGSIPQGRAPLYAVQGGVPPSAAQSKVHIHVPPHVARSVITLAHKSNMRKQYGQGANSVADLLAGLSVASRREIEAETLVGSVVTHFDKGKTRTTPGQYELGDILLVPHVVPNLDPYARLGQRHIGYAENTGPICAKMRPSVVVGIYKTRMTCVPLYTCQGKGMHHTEEEHSLWIRHRGDVDAVWEGVKDADFVMVQPGFASKPNSFVNLSLAFSVSFECPMEKVGSLTGSSWKRLQEVWVVVLRQGFWDVSLQSEFASREMAKIKVEAEFDVMHAEFLREEAEKLNKQNGTIVKRPATQEPATERRGGSPDKRVRANA